MCNQDNCNFKFDEGNVLTDLLSCVAKSSDKNTFDDFIELKEESVPMNESCKFVETISVLFECDKTRKGSYTIKNECCFDVIDSNLFEI